MRTSRPSCRCPSGPAARGCSPWRATSPRSRTRSCAARWRLAIDGTDADEVADILGAEVDAKRAADKAAAKLFHDMGGFAPTIGIIGTVLGLVHVLGNLGDPSTLGEKIASAFVATLWGVMTANVFWFPLANRLKRVSEVECEQMEMTIEGVLAIQAGANPRLIAQKLNSMLHNADAGSDEEKDAA